ncbi:response regulator [bacterium]|nr:response regulator [bacterium]
MKILIAEDRQPLQEAIRFLMDDWGYQADIVDNGLEAVGKAFEEKYDLCLMDLNMPIMDGWEAARIIRNKIRFVPTLALTANSHFRGQQNLDTEFDDYMEKPYDYRVLHEKIIDLTVKSVEIEKRKTRIAVTKEMPMNPEHLKELRELDKKGLSILYMRDKGTKFIVHKNVQNKISHEFLKEGNEIVGFIDHSEDEPGLCHLYKYNLNTSVKCLLPEVLKEKITQENEEMEKYDKPIFKKETD